MKLMSMNIGIKINNTKKVAEFIRKNDADIIALQEVIRHLEESVFEQYKSKEGIERVVSQTYPFSFFGPLWITNAMWTYGQMHRDFGGHVEQGNEVMSKHPIVHAASEHYYKAYSYEIDWSNWKKEDHGRAVQIVQINTNGKEVQILNLHGIWTEDKMGDKRTIDECKYIVKAAKRKDIPTIIVGDFNLLPKSKSIQIINEDYRNLIEEYNIKSTRPQLNDGIDKGSIVVDYIFVNDRIKVNDFKVIETDISDHLPLLLDFNILE